MKRTRTEKDSNSGARQQISPCISLQGAATWRI